MPSISVILPAYNEEKNIEAMVVESASVLEGVTSDYEIIVVDDGSHDGTAEVVQRMMGEHPKLRLVRHEVNKGYGAALYSGFTAADRDLILMTDADKQFDLREIDKFLPLVEEADLVIGYRLHRCDPLHRRFFGWGWNFLVTLLFGRTARDVDCAFKLFRREIIDNVSIESRGATFSAEFLVRAKRKGYAIRQVPVTHLPRQAGRPTGGRLDVILRAFQELIRFRLRLWREKEA